MLFGTHSAEVGTVVVIKRGPGAVLALIHKLKRHIIHGRTSPDGEKVF